MPFTPAHIAAVLPLRNRWNLVFSACVVGSIAPDLEYFFTFGPHTRALHTFPDVLLYAWPGAFAVLWLFHAIIKTPVLEILPSGIQARVAPGPFRFRGWKRIALLALSISIGIATHLAWDSFTHENSVVSEHLSWERTYLEIPGAGSHQIFKWLQWGSSALGLFLVAAVVALWYMRTRPKRQVDATYSSVQKVAFWTLLAVLSLPIAVRQTYLYYGHRPPLGREAAVLTLVSMMSTLSLEVLAFCVLVQARRRWMIRERSAVSARPTL